MHVEVRLPDEVSAQVQDAARQRGISTEEVVVGAVMAEFVKDDPLAAFLGSGDSGDASWATSDIHDLRNELAGRRANES
jgi:hypothetical protein